MPPVVCLGFGRRDVADGLQQAMVVEPGHPFQRGQLHRFLRFPRPPAFDQLGLVQPVDRLGQGVGASSQLRRMVTLSVDFFG